MATNTDYTITNKANLSLKDFKGKFGASTGTFDVVRDYYWTFTPPANRIDIPYAYLIEYEQDQSTLYAQIAYWGKGVAGLVTSDDNPYNNLYHAIPTGTTFILPYFEADHARTNPSWTVKGGLLDFTSFDGLSKFVTRATSVAGLAPGVAINQPKMWDGSQPYQFTINFTLFNTFPSPTNNRTDIINQNLQLTQRLRMSALHSQENIVLALPPAIFEVYIPGIRYSPAAHISQLEIKNIGQMNAMMVNGVWCNVPDAYSVSITITELITESRQILNASIGGNSTTFGKVQAITQFSNTEITNAPVKNG